MTWRERRVREMASLYNGFPFASGDFADTGDVPLVRIRDLSSQEFDTYLPSDVVPQSALLRDKDVVIGMDGDFDAVLWCRGRAALNQRLCALRDNGSSDMRFLAYAIPDHLKVINDLTYSTTVKHLSSWQVQHIRLHAPDLAEQRVIADFLDRETALIDALIEKQHTLIERLRERRDAALRGVLAGRHGWPSRRLGRALTKVDRGMEVNGQPVVTAFRDGQVTTREGRRTEGFTESSSGSGYQAVRAGDLVFHGLDGFAGAIGISDSTGRCSPVYHVCLGAGDVFLPFMALQLRSLAAEGYLTAFGWAVRQRSVDYRNWRTLASVPVWVPDLNTQRRRVADYQESEQRIIPLIAKVERHIELAQERRSALITAAVTGQIDVGA